MTQTSYCWREEDVYLFKFMFKPNCILSETLYHAKVHLHDARELDTHDRRKNII